MFVIQGAARSSWQDLAEAQSARQVAADRQIHTGNLQIQIHTGNLQIQNKYTLVGNWQIQIL